MARKRRPKSLIEVIGSAGDKSGKPMGVPGWFGQATPPADRPAPAQAGAGPSAPAPLPARGRAGEPILSVAGGRVRISLNAVSAAVVLVAIGLALAGAYMLGRSRGTSAAGAGTPVPAGGGEVLPVPRLKEPTTTRPGGQAAMGVGQRKKGYYYLLIQWAYTNRDADDIQRFLHDNQVNTTIIRSRVTPKQWGVWDLRGFAARNSPQLESRRGQIDRLGRLYSARGGQYIFAGPYPIRKK